MDDDEEMDGGRRIGDAANSLAFLTSCQQTSNLPSAITSSPIPQPFIVHPNSHTDVVLADIGEKQGQRESVAAA